ncbi:MAG: aldo/keto reductase [Propionicimonas sp.]
MLVEKVALGGAQFSIGETVDIDAAEMTIRAAAEAGIRVFDTARAYATPDDPTHNERLFARALRGVPDAVIATKGGHFRSPDGTWGIDNRRLRSDALVSLDALGVDVLGLYYLHRADDLTVPIEESVGALDDLRSEGLVRRIGISNVTVAQLDVAWRVTRIDAVQNPLTLFDHEGRDVVAWCDRHDVGYFAYSPLGGPGRAKTWGVRQPALAALAERRGMSLQRLMLSGLLASSPAISVVVGAGTLRSARDAAAASPDLWDQECDRALTR